ncbi:MAG: SpoIIE family protein phosphatase [Alphaproteobacteria bacterium]|nr:SpoIIE family protein phosphatase [Alphaproteobacteria bacterium]
MQKIQLPPVLAAAASAPRWQRSISAPSYACMPVLRREMRHFLDLAETPPAYADAFCLSLCEVISNIVKHPPKKTTALHITFDLLPQSLRLDIADDSTPFASFDAICKTAQSRLRCAETLLESGYGLGCILSQHTQVSYIDAARSADGWNHFIIEDRLCSAPEKNSASRQQRKPVVFLVDDDAGDLKAHHRMLSARYDVVPLADAASALALFRTRRPDLVISDLHMPQTDGAALRRQISALPDGDLVPFVFLTASAEGMNDKGILRLGIDDYLLKPVTPQGLERVAERVLGRREQLHRAIEGRFHRDLQKYLHPHLPAQFGPWSITTLNRMADAGGGDFTLHHETREGLMAVLADVMGHGTEAKFFAYAYAGYLRSLFRATSEKSTGINTAVFLQHLSDAVTDDDFLDGTLLTCQSFHLCPTGEAGIASAGHPPPLLLRADGTAAVLPAEGPIPGMAGHAGYREYRIRLCAGDKIFFATDGFFDVFGRQGGTYDADTLLRLLPPLAALDAAAAAEKLWHIFDKYLQQDTRAPDDATLIIAAYGG